MSQKTDRPAVVDGVPPGSRPWCSSVEEGVPPGPPIWWPNPGVRAPGPPAVEVTGPSCFQPSGLADGSDDEFSPAVSCVSSEDGEDGSPPKGSFVRDQTIEQPAQTDFSRPYCAKTPWSPCATELEECVNRLEHERERERRERERCEWEHHERERSKREATEYASQSPVQKCHAELQNQIETWTGKEAVPRYSKLPADCPFYTSPLMCRKLKTGKWEGFVRGCATNLRVRDDLRRLEIIGAERTHDSFGWSFELRTPDTNSSRRGHIDGGAVSVKPASILITTTDGAEYTLSSCDSAAMDTIRASVDASLNQSQKLLHELRQNLPSEDTWPSGRQTKSPV